MLQRMGELNPAPAHPGMIAPSHFQWRIGGQLMAGLCQFHLAGKHQTSHYQRLRAGAAFGKTSLDQQVVNTPFFAGWE